MKDFLFPFAAFTSLAAVSAEDLSWWERVAEKWGIGFIGIGLFAALAYWTAKRETALQLARDKKEEESQAERVALLAKNNELQGELLKAVNLHASKAEQLSRDAIKAHGDHASALRMLVRKMQRPCVAPIDLETLENHISNPTSTE